MIEPPVLRVDQPCVHCGGVRRLDKLKPLYRIALLTDPFCSTQCARAWYQTSLPPVGNQVGRAIESRA